MPLPSVREVEQWFVSAVRQAVAAGERLDDTAMELVVMLAPGETFVGKAIDDVEPGPNESALAALSHATALALRAGFPSPDIAAAVTRLEEQILAAYRPGRGLGRFEDDVAAANAMVAAHHYGGDETHLMMAQELMLSTMRRYGAELARQTLSATCEAAVVLDELALLTQKREYRDDAIAALETVAATYRDLGWRAAPFVLALRRIS